MQKLEREKEQKEEDKNSKFSLGCFIKASKFHNVDDNLTLMLLMCSVQGLHSLPFSDLIQFTHTGFVYYRKESETFSFTYPLTVIMSIISLGTSNTIYKMLADYNPPMVLLSSNGVSANCFCRNPLSISGRIPKERAYHLKCTNYVYQQNITSVIQLPQGACISFSSLPD